MTTPVKLSKRDKFVKYAELRVNNSIKHINGIGNLSNRVHYDFDSNDVAAIFSTIRSVIDNAESRFQDKQPSLKFSLDRSGIIVDDLPL